MKRSITRAHRLLLLTRKSLREQELAALEAEAKAHQATAELLAIQTERQKTRANGLSRELARLRAALTTAGQREATLAAAKATAEEQRLRDASWRSFPELSNIASNNVALVEQLARLKEQEGQASSDLSAREQSLNRLEDAFKNVKARVDAFEEADVRINQKIGELLRDHRQNLVAPASRAEIRSRLGAITDADLRERDFRELHRDLNADTRAEELIAGFVARGLFGADTNKVGEVKTRALELLNNRKQQLEELAKANKALGETLTKLNTKDIRIRQLTGQFRAYIDERVLWVRSSRFVSASEIGAEVKGILSLLNPDSWSRLAAVLAAGIASEPLKCTLWMLVALAVFVAQKNVRQRLTSACEQAQSREHLSLSSTWISLLLTAIISAPLPIVFGALAVILDASDKATPFSSALATALAVSATVYFTLGFFRHAARQPGLGSHHFNWSEEDRSLVRRHLNWFLGAAVTLTFLIAFVESDGGSSQARLSFVALTGALTAFCHLLLHPSHGLSRRVVGRGQETWQRLRFAVCITVPFALGIASLVGYHFTAIELGWRMLNSIWLVLAIVLLGAVMLRWFYLERKRIALEKLEIRKSSTEDTIQINATEQALAEINLTEIKEQTRSLLRVLVLFSLLGGLWAIWADVTPALNILDRKALWHVEVTVDPVAHETTPATVHGLAASVVAGETKDATAEEPKKIQQPITVADLLFALIVLMIMGIAARNLPSFLEILILRHLKLETGGAYAITTIVQYVVIVVGIIVACSTIGLSWEKVQWLAAAVTLGIGFGLQEIFANFVAGIILLFERPIRIGDVITVDGTTGVVSRIRIRATTITNWEKQELVVPNKDLITGRLTNWTLSDTTNRVVITVGVAYGSDTQKVRTVLKEILTHNKYVVTDPTPKVTFDLFGDSALNFTIRAFVANMDDRLNAIHTLHEQIDGRFREEDIEISFPQRDLHIRSGWDALKEHKP